MDLFAISVNSDESDTSCEEFEMEEKITESEGGTKTGKDLLNLIAKLRRPVFSRYSPLYCGEEDLKFMIMDIGSAVNSKVEGCNSHTTKNYSSIVRLYGITESGLSVCANIRNFGCCFYVVSQPPDISEEEIVHFEKHLNEAIKSFIVREKKSKKYEGIDPKISVSLVESSTSRVFDLRENGKICKILKVSCSLPKFIWTAGKLLKSNAWACPTSDKRYFFTVYEANINHNMRFITNKNFPGCSWIKIKKDKFTIRKRNSGTAPQTHCQLEIDVDESNLKNFDSDLIPPIRTLAFDIETLRIDPENSGMPQFGQDRVIQISNVLSVYPEEPFGKVVFTVGTTDPIDGADVICFDEEIDLLDAWARFVLSTDPDIITGYNIKNFDFPFLLGRGGKIGARKIPFLGRLKKSPCLVRNFSESPKRNSTLDLNGVNVCGRIVCDLFQLFRRHTSVKGLKLNDVAQRYLREKKNDVSYSEFHKLQNTSSATRKILAEYCLQDSMLVDRLLRIFPGREETDFLQFYIHRARNCGTPLRHLFNKSTDYNLWIMNIRKTKNPGVTFEPITPPRAFNGDDGTPRAKRSRQNLFPKTPEKILNL